MKKFAVTASLLGLAAGTAILAGAAGAARAEEPKLSPEQFEQAKTLYFQRCAGCHGVLRKGATGKNLEPKNTRKLGTKKLTRIITEGTDGGMNPFSDIFSKDQIELLAKYIQLEPPKPPEMSLAMMKKATKVFVDPKDYPSKPLLLSRQDSAASSAS